MPNRRWQREIDAKLTPEQAREEAIRFLEWRLPVLEDKRARATDPTKRHELEAELAHTERRLQELRQS